MRLLKTAQKLLRNTRKLPKNGLNIRHSPHSRSSVTSSFLNTCECQRIDPSPLKARSQARVERGIIPTCAHGTTIRNYNSFDRAYSLLCPNDSSSHKLFPHASPSKTLNIAFVADIFASEKDPDSLMKMPEAQSLLNHCNEIEFENHLNTLSDNAEEVFERLKRSRTDQACVFRNIHGDRSLLSVREYKAAHKLPVEYLRASLRPMNLREDVVERPTICQDAGEKLSYNADRLVASAVTQTFEHIIENGLEFSCIGTGPAEVYLRVLEMT